MSRTLLALVITALALVTTGCASGPTFEEVEARFPPLAEGHGRVFFYRPSGMGAAVKPQIMLNDESVGTSKAQGFLFVDREPGDYVATCSTEVDRSQTFQLDAMETRYIRLSISMGFFVGHVSPSLIDPEVAKEEIRGLHYTGAESLLLPAP
jgi:hypothetical protein